MVYGLGFRVSGLGFRVSGLDFFEGEPGGWGNWVSCILTVVTRSGPYSGT